jgi:hypothetical protein
VNRRQLNRTHLPEPAPTSGCLFVHAPTQLRGILPVMSTPEANRMAEVVKASAGILRDAGFK